MTVTDSDGIARWVEAARGGDHAAFEALVRQFQDAVVAVILTRLGPSPDVEDAAQEAFVDAFSHLSELRDPRKFGPWVCGIARNQARRQRRDRRHSVALPADLQSRPPEEPVDLADCVMEKVQRLPARLREPLVMFYINGYSTNEVAELLEVPHGTVRRRLHEARGRLRQYVEETMAKEIKRNAPKPGFAEKVRKSFEVFSGKDEQTGAWLGVSMSSTDPGFTQQEAGKDHQEIMDLFAKGQYKFIGIKEHKDIGTRTYLYRFRLSRGQDMCFGCNEPIEHIMKKLGRAAPRS